MSKKVLALFAMAVVLSLLAAQCAAPTPATVVETVVVKETVEVEVVKEVEVEVPTGGELVKIVAPTLPKIRSDETVHLTFKQEGMSFFDAETGLRI